MELVKAWGWATKRWKPGRARARDKDGKFYKYKENRKGWPEPQGLTHPSLGKPAVGKNIELPAFDELDVPLR